MNPNSLQKKVLSTLQPRLTAPMKNPPLLITPHRAAPLFDGEDAELTLTQIISEISSGNFPTANEEFRQFVRQAGLVNLWFFLKSIASFSGPYQRLTPNLHVDMGNFYQAMMTPGTKAAAFIGRSHYKSTLNTHGANAWEILRNPNLTIALGCRIEARAMEFLHYTQDIFVENELFKWLYGRDTDPMGNFCPDNPRTLQGWNDSSLTLPNKTREKRKPNVIPITAGGSTAGIHVDLLKLDDIIDDKLLDSEHHSGAEMLSMANWLKSSIRTLVMDWKTSRVFLSGTRYAIDDAYQPLFENIKARYGYWLGIPYAEAQGGEWDIYYRMIEEDNEIIFPEAFTLEGLEKLRNEDPWTYWTQYFNNPYLATNTELRGFEAKECHLARQGEELIVMYTTTDGSEVTELLANMSLVQCLDPAATEKGKSAKTSRTAHVVMAMNSNEDVFILRGNADYVSPSEWYDWLFKAKEDFSGYLQRTGIEMKGPFKMLEPLLREEQQRRGKYLGLYPVKTQGDKDARIRTQLEYPLRQDKFYCVPSFTGYFHEELRSFPDSYKKDILDVVSMALMELTPPDTYTNDLHLDLAKAKVSKITGY